MFSSSVLAQMAVKIARQVETQSAKPPLSRGSFRHKAENSTITASPVMPAVAVEGDACLGCYRELAQVQGGVLSTWDLPVQSQLSRPLSETLWKAH